MVALLITKIQDYYNTKQEEAVGKYIRLLLSRKFLEHIKNIRITAFTRDVGRKANKPPPPLPPATAAATKGKGKGGKGKAKDTSNSIPVANDQPVR